MIALLFAGLLVQQQLAPPTTIKATLGAIETDGVELPVDFVVALGSGRPGLVIETSSCTTLAACRAEGLAAGRDHVLQVRLRRLAGRLVVALTLTDKDGSTVAESLEIADSDAVVSAAGNTALNRLGTRLTELLTARADVDADGVIDTGDACPGLAGTVAAKGCPDRDKDGIADGADTCPRIAGVAPSGCPDGDGDGVTDSEDRCPEMVGSSNFKGCLDAMSMPADPVKADPLKKKEPEGTEWGRVVGGGTATFFTTLIGEAAGVGVGYLGIVAWRGATGNDRPGRWALLGGIGAGVGALTGALAPDVAAAGLCDYPLAASGYTRVTSTLLVAGLAGGGGALAGYNVFDVASRDGSGSTNTALLYTGVALMGAAPVAGATTVATGNCISGPPE